MSRYTNLEMVQIILSGMDSDNVNSIIGDEATQIIGVIEETYYNILSRRKWKFLEKVRNLESLSDVNTPTKLKIPTQVTDIKEFRYKCLKDGTMPNEYFWKDLRYMKPYDFIKMVQSRNIYEDPTSIQTTITSDGAELFIFNNKQPSFWTSFDNTFIYLDAWNLSDDNTTISSKTSVSAVELPQFIQGDTGIQKLPIEMFPLLLNEAKSACWLQFKGALNQKAEQIASRQYIKMREEEPTVKPNREWINYGKPLSK